MNELIFEEKQRFDSLLFWFIYAFVFLALFIPLFLEYQKTGNFNYWLLSAVMIPIILLAYFLQIRTKIFKDKIVVGLYPFPNKKIPLANIEKMYTRKYGPISEFGGWGYRIGKNGIAYNAKGDEGLQLILKNGKRILIGTQKRSALDEVINRLDHAKIK